MPFVTQALLGFSTGKVIFVGDGGAAALVCRIVTPFLPPNEQLIYSTDATDLPPTPTSGGGTGSQVFP